MSTESNSATNYYIVGGAIGAVIALILIATVITTLVCLILTMRGRTGLVDQGKNGGDDQTFPNAIDLQTGCKEHYRVTRDSQNIITMSVLQYTWMVLIK